MADGDGDGAQHNSFGSATDTKNHSNQESIFKFTGCMTKAAYISGLVPIDSTTSAHKHACIQQDLKKLASCVEVHSVEELFPEESAKDHDQTSTADIQKQSGEDNSGKKNKENWSARLQAGIESAKDEKQMNVAVQNAVNKIFGENQSWEGYETKTPEDVDTVQEKELKNLFSRKTNIANGLPVSLQSRPDLAVWQKTESGDLVNIIVGEGKNGNYDMLSATKQCFACMTAHLYHWVVWESKVVDKVYGFAICGPKSKEDGRGKIKIRLFGLSLPEYVGGTLQLHYYETEDCGSLRDFIIRASKVDYSAAVNIKAVDQGCPSLLKVPKRLLTSRIEGLEIIQNATASLVIKLTDASVLDEEIARDFPTRKGEFYDWSDWLDDVVTEMGTKPSCCYLKVKNYLGCSNPDNNIFFRKMGIVRSENERFQKWYPKEIYPGELDPFFIPKGIYIMMNDMGNPIVSKNCTFLKNGKERFLEEFNRFLEYNMEMAQTTLYHGDIHMWNVVYEEPAPEEKFGRLHMIDYDEAEIDYIAGRMPDKKFVGKHLTTYERRYIAEILNDPLLYTKNQFINLFYDCWEARKALQTTEMDGDEVNDDSVESVLSRYKDLLLVGKKEKTEKNFRVTLEQLFDDFESIFEKNSNGHSANGAAAKLDNLTLEEDPNST